jgi:hypothetical protein
MGSLFLSRLTKEDRKKLEQQLWSQQGGKCFISEELVDLALQDVDIDHIIPTRDNGKDDLSNFALTLAHYNRSKQASTISHRSLAPMETLRDPAYFARLFLEDGVPIWPNGFDMRPDWLRREIEATGALTGGGGLIAG